MKKIFFDNTYFNVKDTLECGQLFRFKPYKKGYLCCSVDKCCYVYNEDDFAIIECEDADKAYFENYFDLSRDYKSIFERAEKSEFEVLKKSANQGKGVRLLNQDKTETLFSFIVSQNNNIPRIKGIIERLSENLGEEKYFFDEKYYTFPTASKMAAQNKEFFEKIGLGYRAEYIRRLAVDIENGLDILAFNELPTEKLRERLVKIYGVGPKVADCVTLFGFRRSDAFPVDTWIEKVYLENFNGTLTDRKKISKYFTDMFGEDSGYFQQYLFYYKRTLEKESVKG